MARKRTKATAALAVAVLASLFAVMMTAVPAAAANPPIAISDDGVTYGASFPGQLFSGVYLVPTKSATRSFWVKNTGPSGANLAIAIVDVASADPAMLAALDVTAQAGTRTGTANFAEVGACASLVSGVHLVQGQSVRVDVTLAMRNVGGTTAQGALAAFNLRATLTSDDVPAPNGCAPVVPPDPTPTPSPTPTTPGNPGNGGGSVVIPGVPADPAPSATPTPSVTPTPEPSLSPSPTPEPPPGGGTIGNTDRFYQEWFVAAWVLAMVLGGVLAWWAARTREQDGEL